VRSWRRARALIAVQSWRLVKRAGGRILRVDGGVTLLGGAEFVDEVVFPEMKVGDVDEERLKLVQEDGEEGASPAGVAASESSDWNEISLSAGRPSTRAKNTR